MLNKILLHEKYKKHLSFGTVSKNFTNKTYGYNSANSTCMFRDDIDWNNLADNIIKDGKPKQIYCYACSDGSEPLSIALALISKLGINKVKKDFPIIAKDIDEKTLNKAKRGLITLNCRDFKRMNPFAKKEDFFEYLYYEPFQKGIFKIKKDLRDCIEFKTGDIIEDADSLNYENAVIFLRNVWFYLPKNLQQKLVNTFKNKFTDTTKLVIGGLDTGSKVKEIPDRYKIHCLI